MCNLHISREGSIALVPCAFAVVPFYKFTFFLIENCHVTLRAKIKACPVFDKTGELYQFFFFTSSVGEDNKKKLLALKAVIKESALKLQELLFEREQKQKEYIAGMEKCNQQKECKLKT